MEAKQRSLTAVVGEEIISAPVMAEVTRMVPDNIQLNSLALTGQKTVKMTGVVSADPFLLDIDLSQFMIDLENSPGFAAGSARVEEPEAASRAKRSWSSKSSA